MRNKKAIILLSVVSILVLLTLFLTSCGQTKPEGGKAKEGPAPGGVSRVYNLKLDMAGNLPQNEWMPQYISNVKFAQRVEEATQGRVKIKCYYNNQLVTQAQGLEALKNGVVDFYLTGHYYGGVVPESDFAWLPFATRGAEHAVHLMRETEIGKIIDEAYQKQGAYYLFTMPVGILGLMSKKPVNAYEDLKGLKIRTGSALWPEWYKKMGVAPVNVANAEQYEALMRGTIDATIYPINAMETFKLHEVCKYLILPGVQDPLITSCLVSKKTWDSLPDDIKEIIKKVALEIEQENIKGSNRMVEIYTGEVPQKYNIKVIKLKEEEFKKLQQSAMELWNNFAARTPQCAKIVETLKADLEHWSATRPEAKEWAARWLAR